MSEDIKYIKETKEFIVNGKTIKENTLTDEEKKILKAKAKSNKFLVGSNSTKGLLLI